MPRRRNYEKLAVTAVLLATVLPALGEETKSASDSGKGAASPSTVDATSAPKAVESTAKAGPATAPGTTPAVSTDPATTTTTTTTTGDSPKSESTSTEPSALPSNWVPAKVIPEKPKEKPAPAGQAAAVKLYSEKKFAPAAAMFEKFIKDGSANSETHAYLAYCEYSLRHYSKALKQFNWVAKNTPNNYKLRTSAERSEYTLQGQMAGICPQPCLKPNDSRWQRVGDHREIRWTIHNGGWLGVTDHHVGQIVFVKNDQIVNQGTCPTCGGTGVVKPLKDGDPVPR